MTALIICLLLFYLAIRYAYWYYFARGVDFTSDGYYSLLCVKEYKRNGHKRFIDIPNMVIRHTHAYPSLGIWLLSFLPETFIYKFGGLMNSLFDLAYLACIILTSLFLKLEYPEIILVSLTFTFLPTLYNKNPLNSMHFSITWRDMGRLAATLYFLFAFLNELSFHVAYTLLGFAALVLCFYSSQFAMQAVILGSVLFSLITLSIMPFILMVVGHVVLLLVDSRCLLRYYSYKYMHFKTFFKSFRFTHDQLINDYAFSWAHLRRFGSHVMHGQFSSARIVASRDPFLRGIYLLPVQLTVGTQLYLMADTASLLLLKWYLASVVIWFLTLTPILKIFGEPDRYLEFFGYFPILIGVGYTIHFSYQHYFPLCILTIAALMFQFHFWLFDMFKIPSRIKKKQVEMNFERVEEDRKKAAFLEGKNVFPITLSFAWKIGYLFNCKTVYPPAESIEETNFICNYPFPNLTNINEVCRRYQIDYFVVEKSYQDFLEKKEIKYLTEKENTFNDFYILKVRKD